MKDLYSLILESLKQGRTSALATIIKQAGPSPRSIGAKCLIFEDGSIAGTIGGGLLEGQTLNGAKKVFETGIPLRLSFFLKGTDVAQTDMLCGGEVEVFVEPLWPGNEQLVPLFQKLTSVNNRGGEGWLATVVATDQWKKGISEKLYLDRSGQWVGSIPSETGLGEALLNRGDMLKGLTRPALSGLSDDSGRSVEVFVEPVHSDPVLYVFGGGHVSKEIVPLASRVGFKTIVIDDRPEFADPFLFPDAWQVHHLGFEGVLGQLSVDDSSYLVIVTRGHIHDKTVLAQALRSSARYIGMIGSRRKKALIYEKLVEEGFTRQDLERVHAPIGLAIGAETPEEIAVSIVAELIQVRANENSGQGARCTAHGEKTGESVGGHLFPLTE
jgi:xanthine dehydrogenase accessory factor